MGGVVGGSVNATVVAPSSQAVMKSVTWTVTGAIKSQDYRNILGETIPLTGSVTHTWGGGSVASDTFSPFWDTTPGNHTVSVSVVYDDDSTGTASITVPVAAPTVNYFRVNFAKAQLFQHGYPGGMVAIPAPGITYSASVTAPVIGQGGSIAIIQTVTARVDNWNYDPLQNKNIDHVLTTNGNYVLDNDPSATGDNDDDGYLLKLTTTYVSSGATGLFTCPGDSPAYGSGRTSAGYECTKYTVRYEFKDYLVYNAGGIWVEIAETSKTLLFGGDMTFVNETTGYTPGPSGTDGQLQPRLAGGPLPWTAKLGFVSWENYFTKLMNTDPANYDPDL